MFEFLKSKKRKFREAREFATAQDLFEAERRHKRLMGMIDNPTVGDKVTEECWRQIAQHMTNHPGL